MNPGHMKRAKVRRTCFLLNITVTFYQRIYLMSNTFYCHSQHFIFILRRTPPEAH